MVTKNYEGRIKDHFKEILEDQISHEPLVHEDMSDKELGEIFRIAAWGIINLPGLAAVRRAFEENELDPYNPYLYVDLLNAFAQVHYMAGDPGRKPHRSKKYDDQLDADLRMLSEKYAVTTVSGLAEKFFEDPISKRAEYATLTTRSGVRKAIYELRKRQAHGYEPAVLELPKREFVDGRWIDTDQSLGLPSNLVRKKTMPE
jgi:hypothetical protein